MKLPNNQTNKKKGTIIQGNEAVRLHKILRCFILQVDVNKLIFFLLEQNHTQFRY